MAFTLGTAAALASGAGALIGAFRGAGRSSAEKDASRAADAALEFARAAADPTSSRFKNLAALFEEIDRRRSVEAIQRSMRESRRAKARGDVGFAINPERRDEARYGALAEAFMRAKEQSRLEARDTLMSAARGATGAAGAYPVATGYAGEQADFDRRMIGFSSLPSLGAGVQQALTAWGSRGNPQITGGPLVGNYSAGFT